MTHYEEMIPDYFVPDALTVTERRTIEAHIQVCEMCRATFEDWAQISEAARLRQTAVSLPPLQMPEIDYHLNGRKEKMTAIPVYRHPRTQPAWLTVAAMLIVMLSGVLIFSFGGRSTSLAVLPQEDEHLPTAYEWLRDDGRFNETAAIIEGNETLMTYFTEYEMAFFAIPDEIFETPELEDQSNMSLEEYETFYMMINTYPDANVLEQMQQLKERVLSFRWKVFTCSGCYAAYYLPFHTENGEIVLGYATHIVEADIPVSNGVIHIIDSYIEKDNDNVPVPIPDEQVDVYAPTFWEILRQDERTSDFVELFEDYDRINWLLNNKAPVTVFVPINGELPDLIEGGSVNCINIVNTHVVEGIYSTKMLLEAGRIINPIAQATGTGDQIVFSETLDGQILINGRSVIVEGDIITPYGVVHLIDKPFSGYINGGIIPDAIGHPIETDTP